MKNNISFQILLYIFLFNINQINATVLFEDNFDSQQDWKPNCIVCGVSPLLTTGGYSGAMPSGWPYFRVDEYWSQYSTVKYGAYGDATSATPGSQPAIQIVGSPFVQSGKAIVVHNEGVPDSPEGGGSAYSADGMLSVVLPVDQDELWIQFKIKHKPGFKRYWSVNGSASIKYLRFSHWDRTGSIYSFFSDGTNAPAFLMAEGQNAYGLSLESDSARCDPQESNYMCDEGGRPITKALPVVADTCSAITGYDTSSTATTDQLIGQYDGNWHTIQVHAKLNSAAGVADGVYEVIYDGCQVKNLSNMIWIGTGGDVGAGWNTISIGGNADNHFYDTVDNQYPVYNSAAEQWYAIDDVVISTSQIPNDYEISGSTSPTALLTSFRIPGGVQYGVVR